MENSISTKYTFSNSVTGLKRIETYREKLKLLKETMEAMPKELNIGGLSTVDTLKSDLTSVKNEVSNISKNTSSSLEKVSRKTREAKNKTKDFTKTINKGIKTLNFATLRKAFDKGITTTSKFTSKSADFVENLNLMNVAFHRTEESMSASQLAGTKLINTLSDMYGLDESTLSSTVGNFKQLANAMGLTDETGTKLSKTLTQLAIDVSSLYNTSFERTTSVLQSSLAGQTKPIRGLAGADITENTLQLTLETYGIDTAIRDLSYVEKRLIIVTSLLDQLKESQNDFGRTIESVSNQMRIFNEQTQRLTRAIGNMFLPILQSILPYLNAFLMVLVEVTNWLAILLGYDEDTMSGFASGVTDITSDFDDLGTSIGNASNNAKKLQQGLRSFDKINNITTPSSSGTSGGGGGVSGGIGKIDPKILDAFNKATSEYEKKLQSIQMKATKIRDSIMEWLGFTKEIDPITGKVSFKYGGIKKTLSNMWTTFKGLTSTGKVFVALGLASLFYKMFINGSKLVKTLGAGTGLTGIIGALISPTKNLFNFMITGLTSSHSSLNGAIQSWREQQGIIDSTTGKVNGFKGALAGIGTALAGLTIGVGSFAILSDSMKDANENGWNLANTLGTIGGNLGLLASGVTIGSIFGGTGAIIGGVTGALIGLYETLSQMPTEVSKANGEIKKSNDEINKYLDSLDKENKTIDENLRQNLLVIDSHEKMFNSLKNIVDENGKVRDGREEEAQQIIGTLNNAYGLNIELQNGMITNYQKTVEEIKKVIETKKAEAILESNKSKYAKALENEARLYDEMNTALDNYKNRNKELKKITQQINEYERQRNDIIEARRAGGTSKYDTPGYLSQVEDKLKKLGEQQGKLQTITEESKKTYERATQSYKENIETQNKYSDLNKAVLTGNYEELDKSIKSFVNSYTKDGKTITKSDDEVRERLIYNWSLNLEDAKKNNKERYESLIKALTDETKAIESITPEQALKWKKLAETDKDEFLRQFQSLGAEAQQKLIPQMESVGTSFSKAMQDGIHKINPTISIKTDLQKAKSSLSTFFNDFRTGFNKIADKIGATKIPIFGKIFSNGLATGGMPPIGQLFYMNEKGPEFMGQLGGKTFVANQKQMMDLLDKKIGNAQQNIQNNSRPINATFVIKVGDREVARQVLKDLQNMAESNGKPIEIS